MEKWCNQVAAEFLLPLTKVPSSVEKGQLGNLVSQFTKEFKVSSLVVLRRLRESGALSNAEFWAAFNSELERQKQSSVRKGAGGRFYASHALRLGQVFGTALIESTLEGKTSYTEAFRLSNLNKLETFDKMGEYLGVG